MFELLSTFDGRILRRRFWLGFFLFFLIALILGSVVGLLAVSTSPISLLLQAICSLVVFAALSAVVVKRLHDRNKSAFPWAFVLLIPMLISGIKRSTGIGYIETEMGGMTFMLPTASGFCCV